MKDAQHQKFHYHDNSKMNSVWEECCLRLDKGRVEYKQYFFNFNSQNNELLAVVERKGMIGYCVGNGDGELGRIDGITRNKFIDVHHVESGRVRVREVIERLIYKEKTPINITDHKIGDIVNNNSLFPIILNQNGVTWVPITICEHTSRKCGHKKVI